MSETPPGDKPIPAAELAERVAYAALTSAVRLAAGSRISLKRLRGLLDMRMFQELQHAGLPVRAVADRLGVSPRLAADLAKRLKTNFLSAEREYTLPRRIEFLVWARPLSAGRIRQALGDVSAEEVDEALDRLVDAERLSRGEGRTPLYSARRQPSRMVGDAVLNRIDGLEHLLGVVGNAIAGRFFQDDPRALARTVSLRMRKSDLPRLRALYEEAIWTGLQALEAEVERDPGAETLEMDVSVVWAPSSGPASDSEE